MTEDVKVDWQLFLNESKTYTATRKRLEGDEWVDEEYEEYGVAEMGYRHPLTHQIVFESDSDEIVAAKSDPQIHAESQPVTSTVSVDTSQVDVTMPSVNEANSQDNADAKSE